LRVNALLIQIALCHPGAKPILSQESPLRELPPPTCRCLATSHIRSKVLKAVAGPGQASADGKSPAAPSAVSSRLMTNDDVLTLRQPALAMISSSLKIKASSPNFNVEIADLIKSFRCSHCGNGASFIDAQMSLKDKNGAMPQRLAGACRLPRPCACAANGD
jgi:hypothetical protein